MDAPTPRRPRLSLVQLMTLVAYCAAAMAVMGPMVRLREATGGPTAAVLLFGAVSVPLVWAGISFVLVRRGAARDRLIVAFLIGSVSAALAVGIRFLWLIAQEVWSGREESGLLAATLGILLLLSAALAFLARRLRGQVRPQALPRDAA